MCVVDVVRVDDKVVAVVDVLVSEEAVVAEDVDVVLDVLVDVVQ